MTNARIVGYFWVIAAAGCTAVQAPPPPAPPKPASAIPAKPAAPVAAKPAAPVAAKAAAPIAAKPAAPVVAPPAAPAPLDLASLERQLRETRAIGALTKIAIKNQVDDLLGQFRAFYEGRLKTTLAELRRPYDLLVLKMLALLQDADPTLARSIHQSREAIWGILSDRNKFSTFQS